MHSSQGKGLIWLLIYLNNSPVFNPHQEIISEIIIIGNTRSLIYICFYWQDMDNNTVYSNANMWQVFWNPAQNFSARNLETFGTSPVVIIANL